MEPTAHPGVSDGGPWRGPTLDEWIERISSHGTILNVGETLPWMKPVDTEADRLWKPTAKEITPDAR